MSNVINVENILNNEYVSIENNFNDFLRDTTSDGISNIAEFVTVYTTNQEINYFESDLHDQNYEENIKKKKEPIFHVNRVKNFCLKIKSICFETM